MAYPTGQEGPAGKLLWIFYEPSIFGAIGPRSLEWQLALLAVRPLPFDLNVRGLIYPFDIGHQENCISRAESAGIPLCPSGIRFRRPAAFASFFRYH